jgi:hypothetical protein
MCGLRITVRRKIEMADPQTSRALSRDCRNPENQRYCFDLDTTKSESGGRYVG